jgi:hypothetical protein
MAVYREMPDTDAVCTACRHRAAHAADCPRKDEPWPTVRVPVLAQPVTIRWLEEKQRAQLDAERAGKPDDWYRLLVDRWHQIVLA